MLVAHPDGILASLALPDPTIAEPHDPPRGRVAAPLTFHAVSFVAHDLTTIEPQVIFSENPRFARCSGTMANEIVQLHKALPTRKASPKRTSTTSAIRNNAGIVEQVKVAFSREHRLAALIGVLVGAIVPLGTFMLAHYQVNRAAPWADPAAYIALGGLMYSAGTVYQWGLLALRKTYKAIGFVVIVEGLMIASQMQWLSVTALAYLILINGIATGTTIARGARFDSAS